MNELHPLGDRLRNLRERYYLTQQDVADAMGVSVNSYRNYEYGSIVPKAKELMALADLYDLSVDDILGIGTELTFRYDKDDLETLRQAVKATNAELIEAALTPLLAEHKAAFSPPNMTLRQMEIYAKSTVRTVNYNTQDEQLVFYAQDRLGQLKYAKRLIHDGLYYALDVSQQLKNIRNPFYSKVYDNADDFRKIACGVFAKALHDRFGYTIFEIRDDPARHVFCMKGGKYIDVRGWTEDFVEFRAGLLGDFTKDEVKPIDDVIESDPEGEQFANWVINLNPQYYQVV